MDFQRIRVDYMYYFYFIRSYILCYLFNLNVLRFYIKILKSKMIKNYL